MLRKTAGKKKQSRVYLRIGKDVRAEVFIWDFVADTMLGQIIDWIYGQIIGFLGDF